MLTIDRTEHVGGGYLDVEAQIQNADGVVLAQSNDMVARTAKLDVMLPAGEYELIIKGGAEGTPLSGFSSYSSLGYYGISGEITRAGGGTDGGVDMGATGGAVDASATDAAGGGCGVANPSAEAPGPAAGLLLMLAIALVGRRRPRCR